MAPPANAWGHDPIEHFEDDRLDRKKFAKLLAEALAGSPERRSMVVALYGDWGSGKTSTLNLCFEALKNLPLEEQPLVVWFNPWWYSNTGELLAQFFEELGSALEEQAGQKRIGALAGIKDKLVSYRKLIAPAGAVADLFVSGSALTFLANLAQAGVERAAQEQEESRDVHEVRGMIEEALHHANRPVVIAIDDIDRLSASEIRDVFKVVKTTADFPNTRYLLAFDFDTVATALSVVQHTDGAAYLEKIVQVPFRLPDPAPGQLMTIVSDGVYDIASQQEEILPEEREQTRASLNSLASYGLGSFWDNMRRVNRFLDSLRLTLPTVAGEVRVSDFVLLEALRVTEPRVYETLLDGRDLLLVPGQGAKMTLTRESRDSQEQINEATATLVDAACAAATRKELRDILRRILEELFPRVWTATGRPGAYEHDNVDLWTNEKRVCVQGFFEIATRWSLMPGAISDSEVRDLVSIIDPTALRERLHLYDYDARDGVDFAAVVKRIGPFYRTEADAPALEAILRVVLGEDRSDVSFITLYLLAKDALRYLPDSDERKRVLLDAIRTCRVLPVTIRLLLAAAGLWFAAQQDARQLRIENQRAKAERELADQRAQDEALQAYLNQMGSLLLEKDLRDRENSEVRTLARARTLTVLGRLDASGKTAVMEFLAEAELVQTEQGRGPIIRLGSADLRGANLSDPDEISLGCGLTCYYPGQVVRLRGADLAFANLTNAQLYRADLSDANLRGANLGDADLRGASLEGAILSNANLLGTNLSGASLKDAGLLGANLRGADLHGADSSDPHPWTVADLRSANLSDSFGSEANLSDLNLSDLNLSDAFLPDAFLREANLSDADLGDAGLKDANLRGANLSGADLSGADLSSANLSYADLSHAKGMSNEELEQETSSLGSATMPDGQRHKSVTTKFEPALSYYISESWEAREAPDELRLYFRQLSPEEGALFFTSPSHVFDPSSPSKAKKGSAPENAKEWLSWFQRHPNLETSKPDPVSVGGASGMQIDVTASSTLEDYPEKVCYGGRCVPLYPGSGFPIPSYPPAADAEKNRYIIVDVRGETVVINVTAPPGKFDAFSPKAQKVLDTVEWKSE